MITGNKTEFKVIYGYMDETKGYMKKINLLYKTVFVFNTSTDRDRNNNI